MDTDVIKLYENLKNRFPVVLSSSLDLGFKSNNDFPVIHGQSVLGKFELFFDDISFPFYATNEDGKILFHSHLQTQLDAEETIIKFMEGTHP